MTPAEIDRVFGQSRLQMATGTHVEVFRELARHGEQRCYTKRFLATPSVDFQPWTEREWRILDRLGKRAATSVAKALNFRAADGSDPACLQTRDAGATVEQWATLVPLRRGAVALRKVFEDCAYWWSLARHCMLALDALHSLGFVHLELKADNICVPWAPAGAGHPLQGQPLAPRFRSLTFIDVAFSLLPGVDLVEPLPLLRQPAYEYQSPRLLHALEEGRRGHLAPTGALDWRCDFFSLASMLWRYLPEPGEASDAGWTAQRHEQAINFVRQLLDVHAAAVPSYWPHRELIALTGLRLREPELAASLQAGSTFDPERAPPLAASPTPPTRVAETPPLRRNGAARASSSDSASSGPIPLAEAPPQPTASAPAPLGAAPAGPSAVRTDTAPPESIATAADAAAALPIAPRRRRPGVTRAALVVVALVGVGAAAWWLAPEQVPRFDVPSRTAFDDRAMPASDPSRPTPPTPAGPSAAALVPSATAASSPPLPSTEGLDAVAAELMRNRLPRIADAAERRLARVLRLAGESAEFRRRSAVRAAAQAARAATAPPTFATPLRGPDARTLNDAALIAYGVRDNVADAVALQTKAFGANPLDAEVVGNLAFLRLKERPPQAEAARQLALHALTLNDARFPSGRVEDWSTFAIASALIGRDIDARNAWYVALALTNDLQRQCDAAVRAEATYGERLHPSVQALLQRARSSAAFGRCEVANAPASRADGTGRTGKPAHRPSRASRPAR